MLGGWILFIQQLLGVPTGGVLIRANSTAVNIIPVQSVAVSVIQANSKVGT